MANPPSRFRWRVLLLAQVLVSAAGGAAAQVEAVATHTANLRAGPSRESARLDLVRTGDLVTLLSPGRQAGYYRVRTRRAQVGWVIRTALRKLDSTAMRSGEKRGAPPPAPPAAGPVVSVDPGDYDGCPVEGNPGGARASFYRERNRLKNRSAVPRDADLDSTVTLARLVGSGSDDSRKFDETRAAEVTGFVLHVKPGGRSETTNCRKTDPVHRDTHIELTLSPTDTLETRRVIAEVTPRWRAALEAAGVDWSTDALQQAIEGRWVRLRGWLFFDAEHRGEARNTAPGNPEDWRATVWEIHPITRLTVVPGR